VKILALIKQVPGSSDVQIDPDTGVLKREGADCKMNPFDLTALEAAVRIGRSTGAPVTAMTMGPAQAESVLREAFMMGADEAVLLSDRRFAGADVLATAAALSRCIAHMGGFDLIVCGKQTTDGDTAQVGPEVAELLGMPHAAWVTGLIGTDGRSVTVEQDLSTVTLTARLPYPCLITVEKNLFQPRLPSYRRMLETAGKAIRRFSMDDLPECAESMVGIKGSATQVERIFPPECNETRQMLGGDADQLASLLFALLKDRKAVAGGAA
jgi:electron transfer flavoprotein beta subunit